MKTTNNTEYTGLEIAIIGMACRFPGSDNKDEFWNNLTNSFESVYFYSDDELKELGVDESKINDQKFIKIRNTINNKDSFDHVFFDYRQDEARIMNPNHRIFHECVWKALEDSGYDPTRFTDPIGVFAGASEDLNWKVYSQLMNFDKEVDALTLSYLTDKDFLSTLLSYKLNLKGSSVTVNSACSTSLVAVNLACKSLLLGENKIAIAGGVRIFTNPQTGYHYQEGMISSNDGHCRAFDKDASGTIGGEGAGVVVLKRLNDAINDGDNIYAIIKGCAVNNDANRKVGYAAPSIEGQRECVIKAHKFSKVSPSSISYLETHGTATVLGDPIEIEALNSAFNNDMEKYCAIGSVKSNIGHLDAAAGVAGLIKTALSLKYKKIPSSINFKEPNPNINFAEGPFYVNTKLKDWNRLNNTPLRAGISSFGIGGTNVHMVLEEAPEVTETDSKHIYKLLNISAKTPGALKRYIEDLKTYLVKEADTNLADMAYTFITGRRNFEFRKSLTFSNREELIGLLDSEYEKNEGTAVKEMSKSLVFMFPGQGSQYINMSLDLYMAENLFKEEMDRGFKILMNLTGEDFKAILFSDNRDLNKINETRYTQPILFLVEYSLAKLVMSIGITPRYMIGHSIGEYVAATIAGVFSYEDALHLVVKRGDLMNSLDKGSMLSVVMNEIDAGIFLNDKLSIAAINSPQQIVFSGADFDIETLMEKLNAMGISFVKLNTSHAFHSLMQDSIMENYRKELEKVKFNKMEIPFISNLTGKLITEEEVVSVDYWVKHLRQTVKFSNGVNILLNSGEELIYIEIGPGKSLTGMLKQNANNRNLASLNLMRHINENKDDLKYYTEKLGQLWANGVTINWKAYYANEKRRRVSLPTYSFEQTKYPTEVDPFKMLLKNGLNFEKKKTCINDWFYGVQWKQSMWLPSKNLNDSSDSLLIFSDSSGLYSEMNLHLDLLERNKIIVEIGEEYKKKNSNLYTVNPTRPEDFKNLFEDIKSSGAGISGIIHLWHFQDQEVRDQEENNNNFYKELGYYTLLNIVRSFSIFFTDTVEITIIGNGLFSVYEEDLINPYKTMILGVTKVIPFEFTNISCKVIDVKDKSIKTMLSLAKEIGYMSADCEIAIRGERRYIRYIDKVKFEVPENYTAFRSNGTYLITGANGGMGQTLASYLAENFQANLVLLGRSQMPLADISKLEQKGSKVLYLKRDISDFKNLSKEIENVEKLFGAINGVFHAAGVVDYGGVILNREKEDDEKIFSAKISGTNGLISIFQNKKIDFFVNCSSLAASLGIFGEVAYVSANIYQDAIAEALNKKMPIISIEWTSLKDVGMAARSIGHLTSEERLIKLKDCISPDDIVQILNHALYLNNPVQIISTIDFYENAINQSKQFEIQSLKVDVVNKVKRPNIPSSYLPAVTETEKAVVNIIAEFFNLEEIGVEDDFFELGGDSLKAMIILRKLNKHYNINLTIKDFMNNLTVRKLALEIDDVIFLLKKNERKLKKTI